MMNRSNKDALKYLSVLAEEKNITKAADRLFISQPALTNYLNRLEKNLNVKLFDRSKSPIQITAAGEYYIQELEKLNEQELSMEEHLRQFSIKPEKRINLSIGRNRGSIWIPPLLKNIYKTYPDIVVQIFEERDANAPYLLQNGEIDFAIMETYTSQSNLECIHITDERFCFIGSQQLLKLDKSQLIGNSPRSPLDVPIEELSQLLFISPLFRANFNSITSRMMSTYNFYPQHTLHVSNAITAVRLAEEGIGITYQYSAYVNLLSESEKLSPVFMMPGGAPVMTPLYMAFVDNKLTEFQKSIIHIIQNTMRHGVSGAEKRLITTK